MKSFSINLLGSNLLRTKVGWFTIAQSIHRYHQSFIVSFNFLECRVPSNVRNMILSHVTGILSLLIQEEIVLLIVMRTQLMDGLILTHSISLPAFKNYSLLMQRLKGQALLFKCRERNAVRENQ